MRIGAYQFPGSGDIEKKTPGQSAAQFREASSRGVRLLAFQECALCGYPPVETVSVADIDFLRVQAYLEEIAAVVRSCGMYAAVGVVRREGDACFNALQLIGPSGETIGCYDKKRCGLGSRSLPARQ